MGIEVTGPMFDGFAETLTPEVWQWLRHQARLDDTGETVTRALVEKITDEEIAKLPGDYTAARDLFLEVAAAEQFVEFLTLPAYERMP